MLHDWGVILYFRPVYQIRFSDWSR